MSIVNNKFSEPSRFNQITAILKSKSTRLGKNKNRLLKFKTKKERNTYLELVGVKATIWNTIPMELEVIIEEDLIIKASQPYVIQPGETNPVCLHFNSVTFETGGQIQCNTSAIMTVENLLKLKIMSNQADIIITGAVGIKGQAGVSATDGTNGPNGTDGKKGFFNYTPATNGVNGTSPNSNGTNGQAGGAGNDAGSFILNVITFNLKSQLVIQSIGGNGGDGGNGGNAGNGGNGGNGGNAGKNKTSYLPKATGGLAGNGSDAGNGGNAANGSNGGDITVSYYNSNINDPVSAKSTGGNGGTGATAGSQGQGGNGGRNEDGTFQLNGKNGKSGIGGTSGTGGQGSSNVIINKKKS